MKTIIYCGNQQCYHETYICVLHTVKISSLLTNSHFSRRFYPKSLIMPWPLTSVSSLPVDRCWSWSSRGSVSSRTCCSASWASWRQRALCTSCSSALQPVSLQPQSVWKAFYWVAVLTQGNCHNLFPLWYHYITSAVVSLQETTGMLSKQEHNISF